MDIPFVFDNVDACKVVVGDGKDRYAVANAMSQAWVAFARTGNPNHRGIPAWQPFSADERATMIFNTVTRAVDDPYRQERLAVTQRRRSTNDPSISPQKVATETPGTPRT
jgi:para-nitrobenzyl esterase